ncbi:hypothetical protein JW756_05150 [Candidatus Woesearchaeota archaeon]|nr:hypothetical protein [Candidatus Woesearchaeota archaeon]
MKNEKDRLEILVGDDAFRDVLTSQIFQKYHIPKLKEGLKEYDVRVACETMPEKVMAEAAKYDAVVTDLDYSEGGMGREGYAVIDAVSKLKPAPLLILCTSCDNIKEILGRTRGKIDYLAGTGRGHKFDQLIRILISHYSKAKR